MVASGFNSAAGKEIKYLGDKSYDSKYIKVFELCKHGKLKCLVRNYECKDNEQEYDLVSSELKLCKSVSDKAADEGLDKCSRSRKKESISKC